MTERRTAVRGAACVRVVVRAAGVAGWCARCARRAAALHVMTGFHDALDVRRRA